MLSIKIHETVRMPDDMANLLEHIAGLVRDGTIRGYHPGWELDGQEEPAWTRSLPEVMEGGDVGGDLQISEVYEVRWYRQLVDGRFALVSRRYYVSAPSPHRFKADDLFIECQTEYLVCTDLDDPGGTEDWSRYVYRDVVEPVDSASNESARLAAENAPEPNDDEWYSVSGDQFQLLT